MVYPLTGAWQARHRAKDITLRATNGAEPSTMDPAIIEILRRETDERTDVREADNI